MKNRMITIWDSVTTSLWFMPSLLIMGSIVLAFLMLWVDTQTKLGLDATEDIWWVFARSPEGARSLVETIAGSMITVAGVSYSIVIVALTLASQQFGPRILRNFMRDRGNQIVLGVFIGTFVYCLLILRGIQGMEEAEFVPNIAVIVSMLLALGSLGFLTYFIHHISSTIRAENVVSEVAFELHDSFRRIYPLRFGAERSADEPPTLPGETFEEAGERIRRSGRAIQTSRDGYIQAIDEQSMLKLAERNDLMVFLSCRPGDFVAKGMSVVWAAPAEAVDDRTASALQSGILVGRRRTPTQDAEFAIHQLVEVAVRSLSPGINDPYTAITCVDYLGAALCELTQLELPSNFRYCKGKLRIVTDTLTFRGAVDSAYNQIRQNAAGVVAVLARMLESLEMVARQASDPDHLRVLYEHGAMVMQTAERTVEEERDLKDIRQRYEQLAQTMEEHTVEK